MAAMLSILISSEVSNYNFERDLKEATWHGKGCTTKMPRVTHGVNPRDYSFD